MNIPESIIKAARELVEQYGSTFDHLGEYKGCQAYAFSFPNDSCTGFPFVYLLAPDGKVTEVTGFDALDIVNALVVEDFSESVVE